MKIVRLLALVACTSFAVFTTGCTVLRGQESVGAYIDDTTITTAVKAKLLEDKTTGGMSISVETLGGTVSLSGFAVSNAEKERAESIARATKGVRDVRNLLIVRPPKS